MIHFLRRKKSEVHPRLFIIKLQGFSALGMINSSGRQERVSGHRKVTFKKELKGTAKKPGSKTK